jgi:SAM-dependent methyltransferase
MCNAYGILFAVFNLKKQDICNKRVIEVGAMDVNGSVRPLLESYNPKKYIGVDMSPGPGVDVICNAEKLLEVFEPQSFDVVISTEMLEHVRNWQKVISNLKALAAPGGIIYLSTRSRGFPYHAFPYDFWRYEVNDMKNIFSDCIVEKIEPDPEKGIFARIRKPEDFIEKDLSSYPLYSIVTNKVQPKLANSELANLLQVYEKTKRLSELRNKINPLNMIVKTVIEKTPLAMQ